MNDSYILFLALLPVIAFLYSSVGHGGASGYLALMALLDFTPADMKPIALMLNMLVSGIAFILFYSKQRFSWPLFLTLSISSIPMAYLGGSLQLNPTLYRTILGILLMIPAIRIWMQYKQGDYPVKIFKPIPALLLGAGIGFLSGLIGMGGGILLSPVLILLSWSSLKETAGISALFIFVNSLSGLTGQWMAKGYAFSFPVQHNLWQLLLLAAIGGLAGSFVGSRKMNTPTMRIALSVVLIIASCKLIIT